MKLKFEQDLFNWLILDNSIIGISSEPIELKSGRNSHFYVNWRKLTSDAFMLEAIANQVINKSMDLNLEPETFYGVPEGATGLGLITQYEWACFTGNYAPGSHVLPISRKNPKSHGQAQDKYFIGRPKGRTVLLEDTITTAGSVLMELDKLKEAGVNVVGVLALTDRMQLSDDRRSAREEITSRGVIYESLSNALDLLPLAYQRLRQDNNLSLEVGEKLEQEFREYGVRELRLN